LLQVRLDLLEASLRQEDQRLLSVEQRIQHAVRLTTLPLPGSPGRTRRRRSSGSSSSSSSLGELSAAAQRAAAVQREAAMAVAAEEERAWVLAEASRTSAWENMRLAACYTLGRGGHRRDDAAAVDALLRAAQQSVIATACSAAPSTTSAASASATATAATDSSPESTAEASSTTEGAHSSADASGGSIKSSSSAPTAAARHAMALLGLRALLGVGVRKDANAALQWFGAAAAGGEGDPQSTVGKCLLELSFPVSFAPASCFAST